jgi:glucose/arabinose dehydrogenase
MRRLLVVASLAGAALTVCPVAAPAQAAPAARAASPDTVRFPAGRFRISTTKAELPPVLADLAGDWELHFDADGRFELFYLTTTGPRPMDRGGYTVEGDRLTVIDDADAPMSCGRVEAAAATGVYTWQSRGQQLVLRTVADPCMGRRYGLSMKPLIRVPEAPPASAPPR